MRKGTPDKEIAGHEIGSSSGMNEQCLQTCALSSDPDVALMSRGLLRYGDRLFTFLEHDGVEPDNNAVEAGYSLARFNRQPPGS